MDPLVAIHPPPCRRLHDGLPIAQAGDVDRAGCRPPARAQWYGVASYVFDRQGDRILSWT